MNKYIIMGPQGSGKTAQARRLCGEFDFVHINFGEMFRWHIQKHTKIGARIQRVVHAGELVPDDIVMEVVMDRLGQHDWNYGFVLDGFPRDYTQARFFLESYDADAVIHIQVSDVVVMERLQNQQFDSDSVNPGASMIDNIRERLELYHSKTQPALGLFQARGLVIDVDGSHDEENVYKEIRNRLALTEAAIMGIMRDARKSSP